MPKTTYKDPILQQIEDVLIKPLGYFKKVYHGDPILLSKTDMPACIIEKEQTVITPESSATSQQRLDIRITVVVSLMDTLSQSDDKYVRDVNRIYGIMEGRDEQYALHEDSLLGTILHNRQLDNNRDLRIGLGGPMSQVRYQTFYDRRGTGKWSIEASVQFPVDYHQRQ